MILNEMPEQREHRKTKLSEIFTILDRVGRMSRLHKSDIVGLKKLVPCSDLSMTEIDDTRSNSLL